MCVDFDTLQLYFKKSVAYVDVSKNTMSNIKETLLNWNTHQ